VKPKAEVIADILFGGRIAGAGGALGLHRGGKKFPL
jgi:hypothetical protein